MSSPLLSVDELEALYKNGLFSRSYRMVARVTLEHQLRLRRLSAGAHREVELIERWKRELDELDHAAQ